jgi:hypothetical protein
MSNVPVAGETIAVVTSYPELVEAFRVVKARLGLSNKWCDDVCGYADGITDKKLGPSQTKSIDPLAFSMFCQIFAVRFVMQIDLAAVRKMEEQWQGRVEGKVSPPDSVMSKKLLKKAMPLVSKEYGRRGGMVTAHMRTPAQRSASARHAAKSRWEKLRKI